MSFIKNVKGVKNNATTSLPKPQQPAVPKNNKKSKTEDDFIDDEYDSGVSKDVRSTVFSISIYYTSKKELDKALDYFEIHKIENKNNVIYNFYVINPIKKNEIKINKFNSSKPYPNFNLG